MPKKFDSCIRQVNKKIKSGKIKRTYKCGKKKCKTNAYAICQARIKAKGFNKKYWGEPNWEK